MFYIDSNGREYFAFAEHEGKSLSIAYIFDHDRFPNPREDINVIMYSKDNGLNLYMIKGHTKQQDLQVDKALHITNTEVKPYYRHCTSSEFRILSLEISQIMKASIEAGIDTRDLTTECAHMCDLVLGVKQYHAHLVANVYMAGETAHLVGHEL